MKNNNPVLIVPGDPNSVFFEIFFKSIKKNKFRSPIILICNIGVFKKEAKRFKFKKKLRILNFEKIKDYKISNKEINLININFRNFSNKKKLEESKRKYVKTSFNTAFKLLKNKFSYKFLNGPINKSLFFNKKYLGVTEYISDYFNKKKTGMLIYNKKLSVCPITTHLPIKLVSHRITKKLILEKITIIDNFYKKNLKFKPKIGVTGLNPHCESILKFNEDNEIVLSAIKRASKKNFNVKGPFSADTIFLKSNRKKFDIILGMYHDQVLTPIKTLFEYDAFNITMGLPFLRVSPDHGPNIKMIGKNKSNPLSLIKALEFLDKK